MKTITVVGTRPELIRLSMVLKTLNKHIKNVLVHTGQNFDYELNKIFFDEMKIQKADYQINLKNSSPNITISKIFIEIEKIIFKEKPDAFIVLGDTNSCLSAYCAKRFKIPIFHIEAGNRCYDQRVPEEINRKIIDHISDINVTYSEIAKQNLLRENIDPDKVFNLGSPLYEVYNYYKKNILKSNILKKLKLKQNEFFLVSVHREENIENNLNFKNFINFLNFLYKKYKKKIIVSTHPRTMKKVKLLKNFEKNIVFLKPFSYFDYSKLQINSKLVFSDSGSISEESSIMGFNAINLRSTNERQEAMEYGVVGMSHFDFDVIENLINLENKKYSKEIVNDYKSKNFSKIFLKILLSYKNYVKEYTWKEKKK